MTPSSIRVRLDLSDFKDDLYKYQWISFQPSQFLAVQNLIDDLIRRFGFQNIEEGILIYLNEFPYTLPPSQSTKIIENGDLLIVKRHPRSSFTNTNGSNCEDLISTRETCSTDDSSIVPPEGLLCKITNKRSYSSSSEEESTSDSTIDNFSSNNPVQNRNSKYPSNTKTAIKNSDSECKKEAKCVETGASNKVPIESSSSSSSEFDGKKTKTAAKTLVQGKAISSYKTSTESSSSSDYDCKKKSKNVEKTVVQSEAFTSSIKAPTESSSSSVSDCTNKAKILENPPVQNGNSNKATTESSTYDAESKENRPLEEVQEFASADVLNTNSFQGGNASKKKRKRRRKNRNRNALPDFTSTPSVSKLANVSLSKNGNDVTCESVLLLDQENVSKLGLNQLVNGGSLIVGKRRNQSFEMTPKVFEDFKPLKSPPKPGDVIVFKVLELSETYNPIVSDFKRGRVLNFDGINIQLDILDKGVKNQNEKLGKFDLGEEMNYSDDSTYLWKDLIDVKMIYL